MGAARAARSAYFGPLDVARREGQREAYVALLKAADTYEAETATALGYARLPHSDRDERARYRSAISSAAMPQPVAASVRQVELEDRPASPRPPRLFGQLLRNSQSP